MTTYQERLTIFQNIQKIKDWFKEQDFLEITTPTMVSHPGIEAHLHSFRVHRTINQKATDYFLPTSPEFFMKELLSQGFENIFSLQFSFRDEPKSDTHRQQFLMLEWYRTNAKYELIMDDIENLVKLIHGQHLKTSRTTLDSLFREFLQFSILDFLDETELSQKIELDFPTLYNKEISLWEDQFFLLFLNLIEPKLKSFPFITISEFPAPLAALSELNPLDERTCLRFESYLYGIEVGNCFQELRSAKILKERVAIEHQKKKHLYNYELPFPENIMNSTALLPQCSGIALGVERFLMTNPDNISFIC